MLYGSYGNCYDTRLLHHKHPTIKCNNPSFRTSMFTNERPKEKSREWRRRFYTNKYGLLFSVVCWYFIHPFIHPIKLRVKCAILLYRSSVIRLNKTHIASNSYEVKGHRHDDDLNVHDYFEAHLPGGTCQCSGPQQGLLADCRCGQIA